ncbi:MAG TPA: PQQ-binding-like beta-propeller repeat protein, partial [Pirellulales bacterium]|nr:PQQ-binding-like beta-propeller repeat protein [Pirellulales bacterium]
MIVAFLVASLAPAAASAGDWPQWRGPEGTGVSRERNLPINWNNERGIIWRTEIPEWGDSTPCIWGDAIFITTQHDDNLLLLRINKPDGKIVWTQTVGSGSVKRSPIKPKNGDERREQKFHDKQNMASPSPVTNGKVVVVHFGNGDLATYDFDGHQLWHRNLQDDYGHYTIWWGHANSPVIYGKFVISVCMQDSLTD